MINYILYDHRSRLVHPICRNHTRNEQPNPDLYSSVRAFGRSSLRFGRLLHIHGECRLHAFMINFMYIDQLKTQSNTLLYRGLVYGGNVLWEKLVRLQSAYAQRRIYRDAIAAQNAIGMRGFTEMFQIFLVFSFKSTQTLGRLKARVNLNFPRN